MTLFGLVYRALPSWPSSQQPDLRLARAHFYCCAGGMLGELANGTVGYGILKLINDAFYYQPDMPLLRVWFGVSGVFLTLYAAGCGLFLWVVLKSTAYQAEDG